MKKVKNYDIETANARFDLTIYKKSDGSGFVGEYVGTTPKFAQVIQPGGKTPMMKEIGQGKATGSSIGQVEQQCRAEIEKIDGEIVRSTALKV